MNDPLVEFQRDDFDEKRSMVYPKCLPTFASIFARYVAKGTEKESHLLAQLICGHGRDIISKYSASQIIKNEGILSKNSSKKEALEKLKVRFFLFTRRPFKCKGILITHPRKMPF